MHLRQRRLRNSGIAEDGRFRQVMGLRSAATLRACESRNPLSTGTYGDISARHGNLERDVLSGAVR